VVAVDRGVLADALDQIGKSGAVVAAEVLDESALRRET
jgi:hypothetical protein